MSNAIDVTRKQAIELLSDLGFKDIRKANNETMERRLGKTKTYLEAFQGTLSGEMKKLADSVMAAEKITVKGEEPAGAPKKASDKGKDGKKAKKTGEKRERKPGVISAIQELITEKALNKEDLLKALVKRFPERPADGMAKTIQAQLPTRMAKEKGIKITKDKEGKFHAGK